MSGKKKSKEKDAAARILEHVAGILAPASAIHDSGVTADNDPKGTAAKIVQAAAAARGTNPAKPADPTALAILRAGERRRSGG